MSRLTYNGQQWVGAFEGDEEFLRVSMSDAIFQRHLNRYLERIGVPTQTHLELMAYVQQALGQRYQAVQHLTDLEYWRTCDDPEIWSVRHTYRQKGK